MASKLLTRLFGSRNQRLIKKMNHVVQVISGLEPSMQSLSDDQLAAKTDEFRDQLKEGKSIDDLLPEAFAVVREVAARTLNMRHFDVQLLGGMVLHNSKVAEMRTGEGKTLVATLPAYLNALDGDPVHIVTVNDYLAVRDSEWMGKIFRFLGLSVGVVISGQQPEDKKAAYQCDIVYGTNNEYGFDYLRDNMAFSSEERVQRGLAFAVVDEVDSILIDEARTPLIISGPAEESSELYLQIDRVVPKLKPQEEEEGPGDYTIDEKARQVFLTEEGNETAEALMLEAGLLSEGSGLYDVSNISLLHHLNAGLRAHSLFQLDVDYIVSDNQIIIIDEFTGRQMPGRRWSEGLHQAVEAKEGVAIQQENQTLASITFQNYFRLYKQLSGMTGTADTEAAELQEIYGLEVVIAPTNKPMIRDDQSDLVYRTTKEKYRAIIDGIKDCLEKEQPVLVGTASIESNEELSALLRQEGIAHEVLNAKQHDREAQIIAQAGQPRAVTIATNMAGRGTDIVLGGNLEMELDQVADDEAKSQAVREDWERRHQQVVAAGGLHVLGTERNESRRVDNQLRGRSGRQGDPGSSRFYLSMEDTLMRIFGSDRVSGLMEKLGMEEGEAIEHSWVTKAIENAQKKVEGRNFDVRKQLLEYDDVANEQRKVIYQQRNALMEVEDISETIDSMREEVVNEVINRSIRPESLHEEWEVPSLQSDLEHEFGLSLPLQKWLDEDDALHEESLRRRIVTELNSGYQTKVEEVGEPVVRHLEKAVMLKVLDDHWKDHLVSMDHLRQGIFLRGYAQKNPKQEYKRESFEIFSSLLETVKHEVVTLLSKIQVREPDEVDRMEEQQRSQQPMSFIHPQARVEDESGRSPSESPSGSSPDQNRPRQLASSERPFVRSGRKIGRNEPCPCGSGKKYKQCHGKLG